MLVVITQESRSIVEWPIDPLHVAHLCFLAYLACILWEASSFPKGNREANAKGEMDINSHKLDTCLLH